MPHNTVIYHRNCYDGFCSAWIANKALKLGADFFACQYNEPFDIPAENIDNKFVYILDFSFSRNIMEDISRRAKSLICLDHHDRTEKELKDIYGCYFCADASGAQMTWDWFFPNIPASRLVRYVQDYDLWRFDLPDSKAVNANIQSYPFEFDAFDKISSRLDWNLPIFVAEGEAILRRQAKEIAMSKSMAFPMLIDGHSILGINTPNYISETCNQLIGENSFAAAFFIAKDGSAPISLRANGKINVTEIAKKFGGGGHPSGNAANFRTDDIYQYLVNLPDGQRCSVIINHDRCPNRIVKNKQCEAHNAPHSHDANNGHI